MCLLDFCITYIITSTNVIIECISWLTKVTDYNDARWKPEINCRILCFLVILRVFQNSGLCSYIVSISVHTALFLVVEGFPGGSLCEPGCGRVFYCFRAGSESQNAKTRPERSSEIASHRHASFIRL